LFPNAPEVEKKLRVGTALDERHLTLLEELAVVVREASPDDLLERPFHKGHGDLYFRLRSAFGSYYRALATLARQLTSPRLEAEEALEGLRSHYRSGAPLDEAHFLRSDPALGRALLQHFGGLAEAYEAAEIDSALACMSRRLDDAALLERAIQLLGRTEGRTAREWEAQDPLLMEAARHRFDRVSDFFAWVDAQMADRPVIQAVRDKRDAIRFLAVAVPPVGRGGKGRPCRASATRRRRAARAGGTSTSWPRRGGCSGCGRTRCRWTRRTRIAWPSNGVIESWHVSRSPAGTSTWPSQRTSGGSS